MSRQNAARLSIPGLLLYSLGIASAAVSYSFRHHAPYSPLNHFISELSSPTVTPLAQVLNLCFILGSLLQIPLLVQLASLLRSKTAFAAMAASLLTQGGLIIVAIAPMEFLTPHLIGACTFFGGWFLSALLFTVAIWLRTPFRKAPLVLLAGLGASGITGIFLVLLLLAMILMPRHVDLQAVCNQILSGSFRRPRVWFPAILEWSVLLSVCVWIAAAINYLLRQPQAAPVGLSNRLPHTHCS